MVGCFDMCGRKILKVIVRKRKIIVFERDELLHGKMCVNGEKFHFQMSVGTW